LLQLTKEGALSRDDDHEMMDDEESAQSIDSFGFGLSAFPPMESMELDSHFHSLSDGDDFKFKSNSTSSNQGKAAKLLEDAVNLNAMRDELRADIATLNGELSEENNAFAAIPDAVSKIVVALTSDNLYDCWAITKYLEIVSKLISCNAATPSSLKHSVERTKDKWSRTVVNEVAPGVRFEFHRSQQIVRCCNLILDQLR